MEMLSISRFLFLCPIMPQKLITGTSPVELLFIAILLRPNLSQNVVNKQQEQKFNHDKRAVERIFVEGEKVFVRNYSKVSKKWLPGKVLSVAQRSVKVELTSGLVVHCHFNQIRKRTVDEPTVQQPLNAILKHTLTYQ